MCCFSPWFYCFEVGVCTMKSTLAWIVFPTACIATLIGAQTAWGGTVATPLNQAVVVEGQSGGSQASVCGNIPNAPHQQVQVTEAFTSLRFQVSSSPTSTLLVRGSDGQTHCVMADRYSGGTIELPGLWDPGQYSVFVGEQGGGQHPFTLSIIQSGN
jgi:hypothetical protein